MATALARRRLASSLLVLLALALTSGQVLGQTEPLASPAPISPICEMAFRDALGGALVSPTPIAQELGPAASSAPVEGLTADETRLDAAIRSCSGIDEFVLAAASYPELFGEMDPRVLVARRCWDVAAGLEAYATCSSFERSIATPAPAPSPSPSPSPSASPTLRPAARPTPRPGSSGQAKQQSVSKPRDSRARVPSNHRARVPGATRVEYFGVKGRTPSRLLTNASRRARRYCTSHRAIACVEIKTQLVPRYRFDYATGSCTIIGVKKSLVTVAHIPKWTNSGKAPRAMVWWWKRFADRVGWHEAQHVRIAKRHMKRFPKTVVGKPCSKYPKRLRQWGKAMARAQAAFDARDYPRGDAASVRWLQEAYRRFGP